MSTKNLRKVHDLTQVQAAKLFGVDPNTVARWERNEIGMSGPASRLLEVLTWALSLDFKRIGDGRVPAMLTAGKPAVVIRAYKTDHFSVVGVDDPRGLTIGRFDSEKAAWKHLESGDDRIAGYNHIVIFCDNEPVDWRIWTIRSSDGVGFWFPAMPSNLRSLQENWTRPEVPL